MKTFSKRHQSNLQMFSPILVGMCLIGASLQRINPQFILAQSSQNNQLIVKVDPEHDDDGPKTVDNS
jgi:hypothetical protein